MSCHSLSSVYSDRSYIPIVAATRGTLLIRADEMSMTVAMMSWLGRLSFRNTASSLSRPDLSRTPMDFTMPMKKSFVVWRIPCFLFGIQMEQD